MLFEKLNTPEEVFSFKLGSALSMENTVLDSLQDMQKETNRDEIRALLAQHEEDTRQHIANIEQSFRQLGEEPDDKPDLAMEAISKEGKAMLKKIDDEIVDAGILAAAIDTEHHEIAVYEVLVTNAEARGATEVATLLRQNLESEQQTLDAVKAVEERLAKGEGYAVATA
jgi:ferritin-like metal-binding protein YciE